jgi:plastocyanin
MTGSEKYVNSGWLLPTGQEQSFPGSATTFKVHFEKAGTYNYSCIIHPWMKGTIIVK